jgi:hypothetical protein
VSGESAPARPRRGPDGLWRVPAGDDTEAQRAMDTYLADRADADLRAALATKAGRRNLAAIIAYCRTDDDLHPFGGAFAGEQGARVQQAVIGMRHVGLWLRQRVRAVAGPAALEQMRAEFEDSAPDGTIQIAEARG